MVKHMLTSGLLAGFAVALLATLLQFAFFERQILLAEQYESGEMSYFQPTEAAHEHSHDEAAPAEHHHEAADGPFWQRQAKTALTLLITYGGYGLVMVAGFALANQFGVTVSVTEGLLWGLAGFACFQMAPAMGLAPDLPGSTAAPLEARQLWWIGCAIATAGGLGLLAYGRGLLPRLSGAVLLAVPHVIGAPHLADLGGIVPPDLAASFAARSLGVGLVAWVTLGGLAARMWSRPA